MSIVLYDDDEVDDAVESRDDLVCDVFNVIFDDCVDFVDLVVLRDGERTGEGAVFNVEDDDVGRLLVDVDSDAEVFIEEE